MTDWPVVCTALDGNLFGMRFGCSGPLNAWVGSPILILILILHFVTQLRAGNKLYPQQQQLAYNLKQFDTLQTSLLGGALATL